jgi:multidrug efflux pump subunit AcrA (membrane-fusion protein)/YHS domain-containing protein
MSFGMVVLLAIAASYGLGRYHAHSKTGSPTGRHILYYVDPMHPGYKSDKPGVAPDCGMPLEPVYAEDLRNALATSSLAELPAGAVRIDAATQRLLGIRLARVEKSDATRIIRVVGRVVPEDTLVYRVNSGVDGFIRETYNDSVGTLVKKDQKLASYYSPDFLSVASGFLAASAAGSDATGHDGNRTVPYPGAVSKQGFSGLQGYIDRLRNLGMSDVQIKQMSDSRQLPTTIDVVAPANGFILVRNITPGLHFDHAMDFYRIADLSRVWVEAEVYEQEAPNLRPGGTAQITLRDEGRQLAGRITDSLPQSESGGGTVKLRLEVDNPQFVLRPEKLVDIEFPVHLPAAVTVPQDALVDSGARARIYVEHGEAIFEPREVETGRRFGERVEILEGVKPGERVVAAATFLVDSESRLKTATSGPLAAQTASRHASALEPMAKATAVKDPVCGMPVDSAKAAASGNSFDYHGATYYFCSRQHKQAFQNNPAGSLTRHQGD